MKSIAFLFSNAPHGVSSSREGLDAVLSISSITNNISVFFISDGIFHLIKNQNPEKILSHDYIKTFSVLSVYGIKKCYICLESLNKRGLKKSDVIFDKKIINHVRILKYLKISVLLDKFDFILKF